MVLDRSDQGDGCDVYHVREVFLPQMGDVLTEGVCFDTSLARGEWGILKAPLSSPSSKEAPVGMLA